MLICDRCEKQLLGTDHHEIFTESVQIDCCTECYHDYKQGEEKILDEMKALKATKLKAWREIWMKNGKQFT